MAARPAKVVKGGGTDVGKSTYPKTRRIRFRFGDPQPIKRHFVEGDIVLSHTVALLSAIFPPGEELFIRSVRRFADRVTDPELKKRVAGFIGQESVHGQEHRRLNEQLVQMGYPLVRFFMFGPDTQRQRLLVRVENMLPARVPLAITAAAEHFTATLAERMLGEKGEEIQTIIGDTEVRNLLNWHALEELEHKSVAFDVYRSVGGPEWVRIAVMGVLYVLAIPFVTTAVMLSITTDPKGWHPIKVARQARALFGSPVVEGLMADWRIYMKPGFHPDDLDTSALLNEWQQELFGADGVLVGHHK
ncbi:metal-dependent hydrolase [Mycobacterium intracellulare subsp. chimaera]|uniref:metal-dependent hydrolase n=1 Tax=Mycobacterium intracellulare TaxID=1767 RepID=UPI000B8CD893|nr:metal-dependent hydrolase [Mycobacterium intracellulare]ASQ84634.1 metal-dependent hydrolase [Mycobacterium intracellulare subsp. chimaera]